MKKREKGKLCLKEMPTHWLSITVFFIAINLLSLSFEQIRTTYPSFLDRIFGISRSPLPSQSIKFPEGSFRMVNFKCNGKGVQYPELFETYTKTISTYNPKTSTILNTLDYQNCKLSYNYHLDLNSKGVFTTSSIGTVSCSNPEICNPIVKRIFKMTCGGPFTFAPLSYRLYKNPKSKNGYIADTSATGGDEVCSFQQLGEDPLTVEIEPVETKSSK